MQTAATLPQRRKYFTTKQEWLEHRQKGIGASEVGAIMGVNPYMTAYDVWLRKTGRKDEDEMNDAMRAGVLLENAVATYFAEETGYHVVKLTDRDYVVQHPTFDHMYVSPDREYITDDRSRCVLECKTTQMNVDGMSIPNYWYTQLMYQMGIMDLEGGAIAWLKRGVDFSYGEFEYDHDLYLRILEAVDNFWTNHVQKDIPPEAMNSDDIQKMFDKIEEGSVINANEEILLSLERLKNVKAKIKELEEDKKEQEEKIKLFMADNDTLEHHGEVLATWKQYESNRFDKKNFEKLYPDLLEEFTNTSTYRRFNLK